MKFHILIASVLAATMATTAAVAAPKMTTSLIAEKDIVIVEKGKQVKKRVEAKEQAAGEVLIYTVSWRNEGTDVATSVSVGGLIPKGTAYIADSAKGDGELMFSIDGGKTFKKPALLTYEVSGKNGKKETVKANPEAYTNIRWTLPAVPAGSSGSASYEVRVK
ncbi:MAG: hypothetical protein ACOY3X_07605 [Pseudomonadota bacterium]